MRCPAEIAEVLTLLLERGLTRIRVLAWQGRSDDCAHEADHLHNLPSLLRDFARERLIYYWDVERASYKGRLSSDDLAGWEPLWDRLEPLVSRPIVAVTPQETPNLSGPRPR